MSTFTQFQIGDFCQRLFMGVLNLPMQARNTGLLDLLVNSPLSNAYQQVVQDGKENARYTIAYAKKNCEEGDNQSICSGEVNGITPEANSIEYTFKNASKVGTPVIDLGSKTFQDWCDLLGGSSGYLTMVQQQLMASIQTAYEQLELSILQELSNRAGCYADGTTDPKTLQIFLNGNSGAPTVNPGWSFPIEADLAELGLPTDAWFVGGKQFWNALRILQAQYQVPNTILGVNPAATVPANFAYSGKMQNLVSSTTYEKVLVINPQSVFLTTYSVVGNNFANIDPTTLGTDFIQDKFSKMFDSTSKDQPWSGVIFEPSKGLLWDLFAILTQCEGEYNLKFRAQLTYKLHLLPMTDRICGNPCFSGVQQYNLCPLPTAEPCDAPEAPTPAAPLCIEFDNPTECAIVIAAGEVLTFDVGSFTLNYRTPIAFTIESDEDLFLLLSNIFGANPGSGSVFINSDNQIQYAGTGADTDLEAGSGTLTVASDCFADIDVTVALCDA